MGIEINRTDFGPQDYKDYQKKLETNLQALRQLLAQPDFAQGIPSLGAELEMYVVDKNGRPLSLNQEILTHANDPQLTLELNRYNLEYNLTPYLLHNNAFFATEREILEKLRSLRQLAGEFNANIIPIGILPTLRSSDFGMQFITDRKRYHLLVKQLVERRGRQFEINIDGNQPLKMEMDDVTLEGANTSFQVHYRVQPKQYADTFNAIQLITPLVLSLAANSPTLFGHSLWHETRIPLFKQSIDTRIKHQYQWKEPARVNFGHGWVRRDAAELFAEVVRLYPPMIPICGEEDSLQVVKEGGVPRLEELRLQQSSVWLWNRPIYDDADNGHLRIEMRTMPAGPSAVDMVANALFAIGLAEGVKPIINDLITALPFPIAEYNFYRAAQHGLNAKLIWPDLHQYGCRETPIEQVIEQYLPIARQGLQSVKVSEEEIDHYMTIIEERFQRRQTGATWQQKKTLELEASCTKQDDALRLMLAQYLENSQANIPVAQWN